MNSNLMHLFSYVTDLGGIKKKATVYHGIQISMVISFQPGKTLEFIIYLKIIIASVNTYQYFWNTSFV